MKLNQFISADNTDAGFSIKAQQIKIKGNKDGKVSPAAEQGVFYVNKLVDSKDEVFSFSLVQHFIEKPVQFSAERLID